MSYRIELLLGGRGFVAPVGGEPYEFDTEEEAERAAQMCYGQARTGQVDVWRLVPRHQDGHVD